MYSMHLIYNLYILYQFINMYKHFIILLNTYKFNIEINEIMSSRFIMIVISCSIFMLYHMNKVKWILHCE